MNILLEQLSDEDSKLIKEELKSRDWETFLNAVRNEIKWVFEKNDFKIPIANFKELDQYYNRFDIYANLLSKWFIDENRLLDEVYIWNIKDELCVECKKMEDLIVWVKEEVIRKWLWMIRAMLIDLSSTILENEIVDIQNNVYNRYAKFSWYLIDAWRVLQSIW